MSQLDELLCRLWSQYIADNPHTHAIYTLLTEKGETVLNDHIAFRTFEDERVNVDVLAKPYLENGYKPGDEYDFTEKKLFARHYEHEDPTYPLIFISQLRTSEFSPELQSIVKGLVDQIPEGKPAEWDFSVCGRPWNCSLADYETLSAESEYASWMAAFGFRANHFTVNVNELKHFATLSDLNAFIREHGYRMNESGGDIKGSPEAFLEQSSTMAEQIDVEFSDATKKIPSCYYEFALRYPRADGSLFRGFVAKSADKIFESTDKK